VSFPGFVFLETGSHYVVQAGLQLTSSCPHFPSAGITGVVIDTCYHSWNHYFFPKTVLRNTVQNLKNYLPCLWIFNQLKTKCRAQVVECLPSSVKPWIWIQTPELLEKNPNKQKTQANQQIKCTDNTHTHTHPRNFVGTSMNCVSAQESIWLYVRELA
jgi:hypothetical protein